MPISVTCPTCNARTRAPDVAAGRRARCPKCGTSVAVPARENLSERNDSRKPPRRRVPLVVGIIAALGVLGVGSFLTWNAVVESRDQTKADAAVRAALDRWCSNESFEELRRRYKEDFFADPVMLLPSSPRPTGYQITRVKRTADKTCEVAVTLFFQGGPETRVYQVMLPEETGRSSITTKVSDDISGTESHARSMLQNWLTCWVAGEDMNAFKNKYPHAAGKMTTDLTWADLKSRGKRLVSYDITNSTTTMMGFKFTVAVVIEDRGSAETKILFYEVFKDRLLSDGRWTITGG